MDSEETGRPQGVGNDIADRSPTADPGSPLQNLIAADFGFAEPENNVGETNKGEADGMEQNENKPALPVRLEVELPLRPHNPSDEYEAIVSQAVECIHSQVPSTGSESIYTAEFTDGRIDQVRYKKVLQNVTRTAQRSAPLSQLTTCVLLLAASCRIKRSILALLHAHLTFSFPPPFSPFFAPKYVLCFFLDINFAL